MQLISFTQNKITTMADHANPLMCKNWRALEIFCLHKTNQQKAYQAQKLTAIYKQIYTYMYIDK